MLVVVSLVSLLDCHFVRARFLSAMDFLETRRNGMCWVDAASKGLTESGLIGLGLYRRSLAVPRRSWGKAGESRATALGLRSRALLVPCSYQSSLCKNHIHAVILQDGGRNPPTH